MIQKLILIQLVHTNTSKRIFAEANWSLGTLGLNTVSILTESKYEMLPFFFLLTLLLLSDG